MRLSEKAASFFCKRGAPNIPSINTVPDSSYLGSSRNDDKSHNANYILVQYDRPGKKNDVTLAIFHIDNFNPVRQADGRTRVGDIGFSDDENWGSGGYLAPAVAIPGVRKAQTEIGGHSHFELMPGLKFNLAGKTMPFGKTFCP